MLEAADAAGEEAGEQVAAAAGRGRRGRRRRGRRASAGARPRRRPSARRGGAAPSCSTWRSRCAGSWFRDLAAVAEGAAELALNLDRGDELRADADGLDPPAARRAAELVEKTRRDLQVNVSEELALEALFYRAEAELR